LCATEQKLLWNKLSSRLHADQKTTTMQPKSFILISFFPSSTTPKHNIQTLGQIVFGLSVTHIDSFISSISAAAYSYLTEL